MSFGGYPEVALADARRERDKARVMLANGVAPGAVKKANETVKAQELETFEAIAREWHTKFFPSWSQKHADSVS